MGKKIIFIFIALVLLMVGGCFFGAVSAVGFRDSEAPTKANSLLVLDLQGLIIDGGEFLKTLRKHIDDDRVKGLVVRIDSPGGVVGASQEIYTALKRVRDKHKKPVVVSCRSLAASGAYYAALGATRIFTNPGAMLGSIGVLIEFANLENLYEWAKMDRYSITTGPYKDSGADYRRMRPDERVLFQNLLGDVHEQFKKAIVEGRKLSVDLVEQYSDGRVFTGEQAVELGFADDLGTFQDAVDAAAKLAKIEGKPNLFEPDEKSSWLDLALEMVQPGASWRAQALKTFQLQLKFLAQPMYVLPSAIK